MTPRSIQKNILEVLVYGSSDEIVNAGDSGSLERNDAAGTKCRKKKSTGHLHSHPTTSFARAPAASGEGMHSEASTIPTACKKHQPT